MISNESATDHSGLTFAKDNEAVINNQKFDSLGLNEVLLAGIKAVGYTSATPIQAETIPAALAGHDIIGQAQTGSGKTAAFVIPALQKMKLDKSVEVLILTPTRELAHQVATECRRLGEPMNLNVVSIVGGESIMRQVESINRGGGVIVATPGRLLDHLSSKSIKRFAPHVLILDEADEMLDMGFIDSIQEIKTYLPKQRQTLMFSATMSRNVRALAKSFLNNPVQISIGVNHQQHEDISQRLYVVEERERESALLRIIDAETPTKGIVFCRTRKDVDNVCEQLLRRKIRAKAIHGEMSQPARNAAMKSLSQGNIQMLVATDVASRGLDVSDLSHVFNYHLPCNLDRYTHRIGRTGRAGKKGIAVTFASPREISSDAIFKQKKITDFELSTVPTRTEINELRSRRLVNEVNLQEIKPEAVEICRKFFKSGIGFDFMCRMFSRLQENAEISGPDKIGFSTAEALKFNSNSQRSHSRESFGYGRKGQGKQASRFSGKGRPNRGRGPRQGKPTRPAR